MPVAVLGAKALLAVMLLVAGGAKLADLDGFAASVRLFLPLRAGAPRAGAPAAGTGSPDAGAGSPAAGTTTPAAGTTTPAAGTTTPAARIALTLRGGLRQVQSRAGARRIAWGVALAELALGAASLAFPAAWPLSLAVLAAAVSFAAVSALGFAFHRGRSCRCFGALSRRKFDQAGLARAVAVAALAGLATAGAPRSAVALTPAGHGLLLAGSAFVAFVAFTAARSLAASRDALPGMVS